MVFPDYLGLLRKITEEMKITEGMKLAYRPSLSRLCGGGEGGRASSLLHGLVPWLARFGHGTLQCPSPTRLGPPGKLDGEGWGSDNDWDNRGVDRSLSPLPTRPLAGVSTAV
jgi:hypothetical protein